MPDTLQAGACIFPPFQRSRDAKQPIRAIGTLYTLHMYPTSQFMPTGQYGFVLWLFCFRSAHLTFPQKTGHLLRGHFWLSLAFRLHSKIRQDHLSIEAQCGHHTKPSSQKSRKPFEANANWLCEAGFGPCLLTNRNPTIKNMQHEGMRNVFYGQGVLWRAEIGPPVRIPHTVSICKPVTSANPRWLCVTITGRYPIIPCLLSSLFDLSCMGGMLHFM